MSAEHTISSRVIVAMGPDGKPIPKISIYETALDRDEEEDDVSPAHQEEYALPFYEGCDRFLYHGTGGPAARGEGRWEPLR